MLGSTPLTQVLGSLTDNTDHDKIRAFIRSACKAGLSVLLVMPGTKQPFDGRTPRKRTADDKAAQEAAKAAGQRDWIKAKSPSGLALASADPKKLLAKNGYLDQYIARFGADCAVNLAVEVGGSRLIVIDCDTQAQLDRFYEVCNIDVPEEAPPPTVATPGAQDAEGNWVHSDGGHFYFTVAEDIELPTNMGSMTWGGEDGFAVLWDRRYVLIPPSTRPEGPYELIGRDYPADEVVPWLIDAIRDRATAKAARFADSQARAADPALASTIDEWAADVSWASILEPLGWTHTVRPDNCGCDVWTAPGDHASPKSATAHDAGCSLGRYTETNAPLHIWTDNPGEPFASYFEDKPGSSTLSKLQAVAHIHYDGNMGKAMDALELGGGTELERGLGLDKHAIEQELDIGHDPSEPFTLPDGTPLSHVPLPGSGQPVGPPDVPTVTPDRQPAEASPASPAIDDTGTHLWCIECDGYFDPDQFFHDADQELMHCADDSEGDVHAATSDEFDPSDATPPEPQTDFPEQDDAPDPDVFDCGIRGMPVIAPFSHWRDMPPPEFLIDGLIEHGGFVCVIGAPGIGKSSVVLDMACCMAVGKPWQGRKTLKTRVLYLPGEGLSGSVQRVKAWAHMHNIPHALLDEGLRLGDDVVRVSATNEIWAKLSEYIVRERIGMVIFDTFARMATGMDENSATEVGRAIVRFDIVRRTTGCGIALVHHTGKATPTVGRGSSALNGALESEILVAPSSLDWQEDEMVDGRPQVDGKPIEITVQKQKNFEQLEDPVQLMMRNCTAYAAPYITHRNGELDPMMGDIVLARPTEERSIETAIRIQVYVANFPEQGVTRTDIISGVRPDPFTAGRKDAPKAWRQKVKVAVDLAIHLNLIETASGQRLGARFVTTGDSATAEAARIAFTAEAMQDIEDEQ